MASGPDRDLDDRVTSVPEEVVGLGDAGQRESMGNERSRIDPPFGDEPEDLVTVASVHSASLEYEVLAIHVRQRKDLRLFIHCDYSDNGVRPGTFPGHPE